MHKKFIYYTFFIMTFAFNNCFAVEETKTEHDKKILIASTILSNAAKKITAGKPIVATASWSDNPIVIEMRNLPKLRRIATIYSVLALLKKNDDLVFDNLKNDAQLTISVYTRYYALSKLNEFIEETENELILKDYIAGEIFDLKFLMTNRISYGSYLNYRAMRNDKLTLLLVSDKDFFKEVFLTEENTFLMSFANLTYIVSYADACLGKLDWCIKI